MRLVTATILALTAVTGAASALANPIMIDGTAGVQVPETFHAQITYFVDASYGAADAVPSGITRDGAAVALEIHEGSVSENGGSGITSFTAYQACDCDLALGPHVYQFVFPGAVPQYYSSGSTITVTIVSPPPGQPAPAPEISPDAEINPWDIPDDPWPKGFDCAAWCTDHPGPVGPADQTAEAHVPPAEVVQPDVIETYRVDPSPTVDTQAPGDLLTGDDATGAAGDKKNANDCSAGGVGDPAGLSLLLLGLAAFVRSRRRAS